MTKTKPIKFEFKRTERSPNGQSEANTAKWLTVCLEPWSSVLTKKEETVVVIWSWRPSSARFHAFISVGLD